MNCLQIRKCFWYTFYIFNNKISDDENYILRTHALFSYGRVLETMGKVTEAIAAYTEVNDISPDDDWAKLAKTRAIKLQLQEKSE